MPPSRPITHTKFELIFVEVCPERPAVDTVQDFCILWEEAFFHYIRLSLDLPKLSTTSLTITKFDLLSPFSVLKIIGIFTSFFFEKY